MDTVTYPDEAVRRDIADGWVGLKIDLLARHPDFKTVIGNKKILWSPAMFFLDASGRELRSYVGWLPPASFRAELALARVMDDVYHVRFDAAAEKLGTLLDTFEGTEAEPEARYWHGITRFLGGKKDMAALRDSWEELAKRFPGNRFATHASVIDDAPG